MYLKNIPEILIWISDCIVRFMHSRDQSQRVVLDYLFPITQSLSICSSSDLTSANALSADDPFFQYFVTFEFYIFLLYVIIICLL